MSGNSKDVDFDTGEDFDDEEFEIKIDREDFKLDKSELQSIDISDAEFGNRIRLEKLRQDFTKGERRASNIFKLSKWTLLCVFFLLVASSILHLIFSSKTPSRDIWEYMTDLSKSVIFLVLGYYISEKGKEG